MATVPRVSWLSRSRDVRMRRRGSAGPRRVDL